MPTIYVPSYSTVNWVGEEHTATEKFVMHTDSADCNRATTLYSIWQRDDPSATGVCTNSACNQVKEGSDFPLVKDCPSCTGGDSGNYSGIETDANAFHMLIHSCDNNAASVDGDCSWNGRSGSGETACIGITKAGLNDPVDKNCPKLLNQNPDYLMAHQWSDPETLWHGAPGASALEPVDQDNTLVLYLPTTTDGEMMEGDDWPNKLEIGGLGIRFKDTEYTFSSDGHDASRLYHKDYPAGTIDISARRYIRGDASGITPNFPIWCTYDTDNIAPITNQVDLAHLFDFFNIINGDDDHNGTNGIRKELEYARIAGSDSAAQAVRAKIGSYCLGAWNHEAENAAVATTLALDPHAINNYDTYGQISKIQSYKTEFGQQENACDLPGTGGTGAWSPQAIEHCTDTRRTSDTCAAATGVQCEWKAPEDVIIYEELDDQDNPVNKIQTKQQCEGETDPLNCGRKPRCQWNSDKCMLHREPGDDPQVSEGYCIPKSVCTPLTTSTNVPAKAMCKVWWDSLNLELPIRPGIQVEVTDTSYGFLQCDSKEGGATSEDYQVCRGISIQEASDISNCTGLLRADEQSQNCKIQHLNLNNDGGKCAGILADDINCTNSDKATCLITKDTEDQYICKWTPQTTSITDLYLKDVDEKISNVCDLNDEGGVGWSSACQCHNLASEQFSESALNTDIQGAINFFKPNGGGAACGISGHDLSDPTIAHQQFAKCMGVEQCEEGSDNQRNLLPLSLYTTLCDQAVCSNACISATTEGEIYAGRDIIQDVENHCAGETVNVGGGGGETSSVVLGAGGAQTSHSTICPQSEPAEHPCDAGKRYKSDPSHSSYTDDLGGTSYLSQCCEDAGTSRSCPSSAPSPSSCGVGKQYKSEASNSSYTGAQGGDNYQSQCCESAADEEWPPWAIALLVVVVILLVGYVVFGGD